MLTKTWAHTQKGRKCFLFWSAISLILSESVFCQGVAASAHNPSKEELNILRAAGVSPEFNSSDGLNLRVCLMRSPDRECNTGSFGGNRAFSPVAHLGKVVGQRSALSANEAMVITLYNFRFKPCTNRKDKSLEGKTISVLRRNGMVIAPEGVIRQEDPSVPPLVAGTDYILLLRELAGSGGYVSTTEDLDFKAFLSPGSEGRVASLQGNGRGEITFDSLSKLQNALEKSLSECGTRQ